MISHIVIIGASVSGHNIALRLREKNKDCRITLISEENYPAYDHLKLADFVSTTISERDIFLCNEDDYLKNNINLIKNKKVGSLNTQKKLVYFKDKGSINYDILIIASGRSPVIPDIPGAKKTGVYRLYTLDDVKEFLKHYIAQPVCIVGSNSFAIKMAEAVSEKYGVEIKLLSRAAFDPADIPKDTEVIHDSLQEIVGEGQTQAVKLKSGKALGVCAVLFMDNYKSNIDFLKGADIQTKDDFVLVDGWMRTNQGNIFACGSVVRKDSVVISMMLVDHIIAKLGEVSVRLPA
jgi:NAD(P)H-nitrite reductase large subunit